MDDFDQRRMPLLEALSRYIGYDPAYFRIPGHRGAGGVNAAFRELAGDAVFALDRTETPLLDDLHAPREAIKEAQELAASLFGADRTWFSVNGTSAANQAMMIACASPGEKIILARNAHRSCLSGLILGDIRPVYVKPRFLDSWGFPGGLHPDDVKAALADHPDAKAVLMVSPTYHGLASDIATIADVCHRAGVPLLVDEAHGAHFYFSGELPAGALASGADACAQSTHKVLGALTQASMIHTRGIRVDADRLSAAMKLLQSTSPSYLLLASLDSARQEMAMRGRAWTDKSLNLAAVLCGGAEKIAGLRCLGREVIGGRHRSSLNALPPSTNGIADLDSTRVTVDVSGLGLTGFEAKRVLFAEFAVDLELADLRNVTGIITAGNTIWDIEKYLGGLRELGAKAGVCIRPEDRNIGEPPVAPVSLSPRQAFFAAHNRFSWEDAKGRVSAETIALYPPGIPIVYPGEVITPDVWEYIDTNHHRGCGIQGPSDSSFATVLCVEP